MLLTWRYIILLDNQMTTHYANSKKETKKKIKKKLNPHLAQFNNKVKLKRCKLMKNGRAELHNYFIRYVLMISVPTKFRHWANYLIALILLLQSADTRWLSRYGTTSYTAHSSIGKNKGKP